MYKVVRDSHVAVVNLQSSEDIHVTQDLKLVQSQNFISEGQRDTHRPA